MPQINPATQNQNLEKSIAVLKNQNEILKKDLEKSAKSEAEAKQKL